MSIWKQKTDLQQMNDFCNNTLVSHLDIKITEIGDNFLKGTMPVDNRTKQPLGILHGGANCVLAESLGSIAANYVLDDQHYAVGLNISTHHIKATRNSIITAIAKPLHLGRTTQLWSIDTFNETGKLTSSTRLEMMVLKKKVE
jgi:uncharacterized protein (TIGR00369 family)